jgi:hypothetical protein
LIGRTLLALLGEFNEFFSRATQTNASWRAASFRKRTIIQFCEKIIIDSADISIYSIFHE